MLREKSRTLSFFLTLFLGPLGLLYSSVVGGVILIILAVATFPTIIGPLICWILAIAIGDHCAHKHNKSVKEFKELLASRGGN
jgi:hypothetical protein